MSASTYTVVPHGHSYAIHHEHLGLLAGYEDMTSIGDAESWIEQLDAEDAERTAIEAFDEADDGNPISLELEAA